MFPLADNAVAAATTAVVDSDIAAEYFADLSAELRPGEFDSPGVAFEHFAELAAFVELAVEDFATIHSAAQHSVLFEFLRQKNREV